MQTRINLALSLTLFCVWAESAPAGLGTLQFDRLGTDLSDLKYEVEEEDLDDYAKLLDEIESTTKAAKAKTSNKNSGYKNIMNEINGGKSKHTIADLKKFFKDAGLHDEAAYDDDGVYAIAEALAGSAVGVKGNENRTYKKGTKTHGFHRVHHKDEYKKDKEFFEDDVTDGSLKKVGVKGHGYRLGAGAGVRKGHVHHDRHKGIYGKQGYLDEDIFDNAFKGYSGKEGLDSSFSNES